jgi:hypothetical protein
MSYTIGNGYVGALLKHMAVLLRNNNPTRKITAPGLLGATLARGAVARPEIELTDPAGHYRDIRLKFQKRTTAADTSNSASCDINLVPQYSEVNIDSFQTREIGYHIDMRTIARYEREASQMVRAGGAPTAFMQEHLETLLNVIPGLVSAINTDLLSSVAWGVNAVTGTNAATTVNFNNDTNINLFSEGWTKVLNDYAFNEGFDTPVIVGGGLVNAAAIQSQFSQAVAQSALNNAAFSGAFDYHFDIQSQTTWGNNQFAVLQPGTFGLVEKDDYRGDFGYTTGPDTYFNMSIPVQLPGSGEVFRLMPFDFHLKHVNCPREVDTNYDQTYGDTRTINEGFSLIIRKNFALWQMPNTMFKTGDRLAGQNGAFRYTATNA